MSPTESLMRYLDPHAVDVDHDATQEAVKRCQSMLEGCRALARFVATDVPDGPEKTAGLRKLLEARDCFLRACGSWTGTGI